MDKKIRVIVSDITPLYPYLWGGAKRVWKLFMELPPEKFYIDYVGLFNFVSPDQSYVVRKVKPNVREILTFHPSIYRFWNYFEKFSGLNELGFTIFPYLFSRRIKKFRAIFDILKTDIIISSHPWSSVCFNRDNATLFVYDAHNCEYYLMQQLLDRHKLWNRKILKKIFQIEKEVCSQSDIILACSQRDKENFQELYNIPEEKIFIIPNGAVSGVLPSTEEKLRAKRSLALTDKPVVSFVGSLYRPNIDAVEFITKKLVPSLKDYVFVIAGSAGKVIAGDNISDNLRIFPDCGDGELTQILKASDIAINPVSRGSGTNIKLLDYISKGLPAVSTEFGCRGFDFIDRQEIYISKLELFPEAIQNLLKDKELYESIRDKGYKKVTENYNWDNIRDKVEKLLLEKLREKRPEKVFGELIKGTSKNKLEKKELFQPDRVVWIATIRCNLACLHCNHWKSRTFVEEVKTEEIRRLLPFLKQWLGDFLFIIGGGEPFLREDLFEILNLCRKLNIRTSIPTNGTLLSKENCEKLLKLEPSNLNISLDGLSSSTHEFTRGRKGILPKILEAVDYLTKKRSRAMGLNISTIIMETNLDEIPKLIDLVAKKKLDGVYFLPLNANFNAPYSPDWYRNSPLWPKDTDRVRSLLDYLIRVKLQSPWLIINSCRHLAMLKKYYENPGVELLHISCEIGKRMITITEDGHISLCPYHSYIGTIRGDNIKDCFYSFKADIEREVIKNCKENCKFLGCYNDT